MSALPTVSVVIPSYRRLGNLPVLIKNHLDQGADEIVVVLDGPHDDWQHVLMPWTERSELRIVELAENRGLALARIAGLEASAGDVIVMTDDDVVPQPGFIETHRRFHSERPDQVLLGYMPVDLPARRGRDDAPTFLYARDYETQVANWRSADSAALLGSLWGGNVSLPRALYLRAEQYKASQRLNYNEDLDLGLRLTQVGAAAVFDDRARALHRHHRDLAGFIAECVVRGEAIFDLEQRWGATPGQLRPLLQIPPGYHRLAGHVQRAIGARDRPGTTERLLVLVYRVLGVLQAWTMQDSVVRLMRRGLVIRGHRLAAEKGEGAR